MSTTEQESELGFSLVEATSLLPILEGATPQRSSTELLHTTSTTSDAVMTDCEQQAGPSIGIALTHTTQTLTPKWSKRMDTVQICEHASCTMIRIGLGWCDPGGETSWESLATGSIGRSPITEWIKEPQQSCECGAWFCPDHWPRGNHGCPLGPPPDDVIAVCAREASEDSYIHIRAFAHLHTVSGEQMGSWTTKGSWRTKGSWTTKGSWRTKGSWMTKRGLG